MSGPPTDRPPAGGAYRCRAVVFDMDGVVTDTAAVHAEAWKQLFDEVLGTTAATSTAAPGRTALSRLGLHEQRVRTDLLDRNRPQMQVGQGGVLGDVPVEDVPLPPPAVPAA